MFSGKLFVTLGVLSAMVVACSSSSSKKEEGGGEFTAACDSTLTFDKDIASMIKTGASAHCAECHSELDSKAEIEADKTNVIDVIESGRMPKGDSSFANSADYKTMLNWLACSPLK